MASRLVAEDPNKTEASTVSQFHLTTSCMCIIYLLVVSSLLPLFAIPIPRFSSGGDFPDLGAFPSKLKNQLIFATIYGFHCIFWYYL